MNGILKVNKPKDHTSFDVVARIRRAYKIKSVGHSGTLDPQATGVLLILIGKSTKMLPYIVHDQKEYIATIKLGAKTFTGDIFSDPIEEKEIVEFNKEMVEDVLQSFLGKQMQIPPMVSAIKINGKKLYEYARENIKVEVKPREIEISEIELLEVSPEIKFRAVVSSGTYIRTLCEDIAAKLDNLGAMSSLIRTQVGNVLLEDCYELEDLLENVYEPISLYDTFEDLYEMYEVNDKELIDVKNGKRIKIDRDNDLICITYQNELVAMYEKDSKNIYKSKRGLW